MAINLAKGNTVTIKLGDGGDPEAFAHPCMINTSRSISFDGATSSDNVEDCDDPDNPATVYNFKSASSLAVDGAGKLDADDLATWKAYALGPDPVNAKLYVGATLVASCALMITKVAVTGDVHKYAEVSITAVSHGPIT